MYRSEIDDDSLQIERVVGNPIYSDFPEKSDSTEEGEDVGVDISKEGLVYAMITDLPTQRSRDSERRQSEKYASPM